MEKTCLICLDNIPPQEPGRTGLSGSGRGLEGRVAKPGCSHEFHAKCLAIWFKTREGEGRSLECPTCRGETEIALQRELIRELTGVRSSACLDIKMLVGGLAVCLTIILVASNVPM